MKQTNFKNALLAGMALIGVTVMGSCKKSDSTLPKIGPYDNSDQIATSNLLAHWTFDGTNNEIKSATAPTTAVGASFTSGVKGQALSLANGYLLFPTIASLSAANAMPSVTVSMWVNVSNGTNNGGTTASSFFALTQALTAQMGWNKGPINIYAETARPSAYNDTLVFHSAFHTYMNSNYETGGDNINDYGVRGTDFQTVLGANKWVNYVMRYDGVNSNIDLYANGIRVSNNNFRHRETGSPAMGIGNIVINPPTQVLIGAFPVADVGYTNSANEAFTGRLTGSIDEIRVYNTAIPETDIGYLYQLELAGR